MAFDYKKATEGIVNAIDMYSNAMNQRAEIENALMMDEIKNKRKEEYNTSQMEREAEYMDPMQKAFAARYFSENPSQVSQFEGIPGIGMEATKAKGQIKQKQTGGPAQTSQGVTAPSTYTPPTDTTRPTTKMTARGFESMSAKERVISEVLAKVQAGTATKSEKELAGIKEDVTKLEDIKEKDVEAVRKIAKELAIDELRIMNPNFVDGDPIPEFIIQSKMMDAMSIRYPNIKKPEEAAQKLEDIASKEVGSTDGKVKVKSPDGQIGYIPKEKLDAAISQGFTKI